MALKRRDTGEVITFAGGNSVSSKRGSGWNANDQAFYGNNLTLRKVAQKGVVVNAAAEKKATAERESRQQMQEELEQLRKSYTPNGIFERNRDKRNTARRIQYLEGQLNRMESDDYYQTVLKRLGELDEETIGYLDQLRESGTPKATVEMQGIADNRSWEEIYAEQYRMDESVKKALLDKGYTEEQIAQYVKDRTRQANRENYEAEVAKSRAEADNGVIGAVTASAKSIPQNLTGGLGYLSLVGQRLHSEEPLDYYTPEMVGQAKAQAARQTVSQKLEENTELSTALTGNVASFLYNTGMSMADSAAIATMTAVGVPPAVGTAFLGGTAATQATVAAKERGVSDERALLTGLAAGTAEAFFEKVSLDKLLSTSPTEGLLHQRVMQGLKNMGIQGTVEGSEELATSLANAITDALINGGQSEYNQNVQNYMADGKSAEEADKLATRDFVLSLGADFLGGFISGGTMSIGADSARNSAYKSAYGENAQELTDEALEIDPKNETALYAKKRLEQGKPVSGAVLRSLVSQNQRKIDADSAGAAEAAEETGEATQDTAEVSDGTEAKRTAVSPISHNTEFTEEEARYIVEEGAKEFGNAASSVVNSYIRGQDPQMYMAQARLVFNYGKTMSEEKGIPYALNSPLLKSMDETQIRSLFNAGRMQAKAIPVTAVKGKGEVVLTGGIDYSLLGEARQKQVNALSSFAKATGYTIELFESAANEEGKYTAELGSFDPSTGVIRIDINAGRDKVDDLTNYAMVRVASHEITHSFKKNAPQQYVALRDYVTGILADKGRFDDLVDKKMADLGLDRETAVDEVVADGCEMLLRDTRFAEKLAGENRTLFEKIRDAVRKFVKKIRDAFEGVEIAHEEAQLLKDAENLQKLWDEALARSVENVAAAEAKNTTGDGGVKKSARIGALTQEEIRKIQSIGRKSVNQFSAEDIAATESFAQRYWKEMGVKSPFFRAWFGDWRESDESAVTVATKRGDTRVEHTNRDTGWVIRNSGKVHDETRSHNASANREAVPYLPYLDEIIENAVLLDTASVGSKKSENSLLMHYLYAVADIGNGQEVLKLTVEEMYDPGRKGTKKRAYMLQNVEKAFAVRGRVQGSSLSSVTKTTNAVRTVADLFALVKQFDGSFRPNPASKIVDADGNPKIVYHGTSADFTVFGYDKVGSATGVGILGDGFYFADKKKLAKGYGGSVFSVYLDMKNPYVAKETDVYNLSVANMQAKGHDGVILHAPAGDVYMVFDNTQIKSATDNIGTFDSGNPDIRYSFRTGYIPTDRSILASYVPKDSDSNMVKRHIAEYQQNVQQLRDLEQTLREQREQLRSLTGDGNKKQRAALRDEIIKTQNRIQIASGQLLRKEKWMGVRTVLNREKDALVKQAKAEENEKLKKYRAQRWDTENRRKLRERITYRVKTLDKMLREPTDDKHIPDGFQGAILDFCEAFTENTTVFPEKRLDSIRAEYAALESKVSETSLADLYDESIREMLEYLGEVMSGKRLSELDMEQLSMVKAIADHFAFMVKNENEIFVHGRKVKLDETAQGVIAAAKEHKRLAPEIAKGEALDAFEKFLTSGNLRPVYFFRDKGSDMEGLFQSLLDAQSEYAFRMDEAMHFAEETEKATGYSEWGDSEETLTFTNSANQQVTLNLQQAMSLLATYERELQSGNLLHVTQGGFLYEKDVTGDITVKGVKVPVIKQVVQAEKAKAHPMSAEDMDKVRTWLGEIDPRVLDYMGKMVEYLSTTMADYGNETSMQLHGYKKFGEGYYWPIKSAEEFLQQEPGKAGFDESRWKHKGFTKATVKGANNPFVLRGFVEVWSNHVSQMCMYSTMAVPQDAFVRVMNYKTQVDPTGSTASESVKSEIRSNYGQKALAYIDTYLSDINGGLLTDPRAGALNRLVSLFKKNAVFGSASVALQQYSAVIRAMVYLDPKYFVRNAGWKKTQEAFERAKQYSGVAIIKEIGGFDTTTGRSGANWLMERDPTELKDKAKALFQFGEKDTGYRDRLLTALPAKMDKVGWGHIWIAAENEIADTTDLERGTEAFYEAVAKRFEEVIELTQVYDSVLTRSENMRGKDGLIKAATSFMAEPTVTMNMFVTAAQDAIAGKDGAKARLAKTAFVLAMSVIVNNILKALATAGRDKDEDQTILEKYVEDVVGGIISDVNPFGYVPILRDVKSIWEGYSVEASYAAVISDVYDAWTKWEKNQTVESGFDVLNAVAALFGIPAKNLKRDIMAVLDTFLETAPLSESSKRGFWNATREGLGIMPGVDDKMMEAFEADRKGNEKARKKALDEITRLYEDKAKQYRLEGKEDAAKKAKSSLKSTITSVLKPLYQAAKTQTEKNKITSLALRVYVGGEQLYNGYDFERYWGED